MQTINDNVLYFEVIAYISLTSIAGKVVYA